MVCNNCGKEFEGKFCPSCGQGIDNISQNIDQQQNAAQNNSQQGVVAKPLPGNKKLKWWQILLIILGVIIVIGVIGGIAGGGSDNEPVDNQLNNNISTNDNDTQKNDFAVKNNETGKNKIYAINEAATNDDVKLTVTKVEKSGGNDFNKPKDGMEFVIVTVKYENTSDSKNISYNPYDFKMKNSQGQITSQSFSIIDTETALSSGDLAPGGNISGTIVFEQPKNDTGLILQYTGSIFSSDTELQFKLS